MVAIIDGEIVTPWDICAEGHFGPEGPFGIVSEAMASLVKSKGISNIYLHYGRGLGARKSLSVNEEGIVEPYEHFYCTLPAGVVVDKDSIATKKGNARSNAAVLKRSLEEITTEAVEIVVDLIEQGSLYRGEEHLHIVRNLERLQSEYGKADNLDLFVWQKSLSLGPSSAIRNTVIGSLLVDLSEGVALEDAVRMFESKVAPTNYKRP